MEMSNKTLNSKATKLVLVAGILAVGLLAAVLVGSIPIAGRAVAQEPLLQHPVLHNNTVMVKPTVATSGTATATVKPDKVSVTLGVETEGTTAAEASSKNADLMARLIAALKELGVSEDQISTSNYSVYPVYSHTEPANVCRVMEGYPIPPECYVDQVLTGYKAVNSITVTLDAQGDLGAGEVIDSAVAAGANNVHSVYFFVSQELQQQVRDSLIKDAIANAKHRAEIAADAVGHTVSGVHSINLNDVYFPAFYDKGVLAEGSTPVLPGVQEVSMTVNVVFFMSDILA